MNSRFPGTVFRYCALIGLLGVSQVSLSMPRVSPEEEGFSSSRLAMITGILRHYVDAGHVPGMVAGVSRHGKVVYMEAMGWQDVEDRVAMREDAMFQIRSMSKPITSAAVMQLVEQGRLQLDDPVSRYISSFAHMQVFDNPAEPDNSETHAPQRPILISDLLLHTGGLSHRDGALYRSRDVRSRSDTLAELVEKVAAVPLIAEPGTQWVYSISTTVLGRIVEIVSGQPFDEYLQQHVLAPLGMADTGFYVPETKQGQVTHIFRLGSDGMQREPDMDIPITQNPPLLEGAAGMVSTVPDYLLFLQAMLNGGILEGERIMEAATVDSMITNQLPDSVLPIALNPQNPMRDLGWGYGFSVVIDSSQSAFARSDGEFGWNGSLGTFSWADPQTGVAIVLMLQIQPSGAYNLSALFKALVSQAML
jgi:CubicO group peptidase (beta-lactamase class C family)